MIQTVKEWIKCPMIHKVKCSVSVKDNVPWRVYSNFGKSAYYNIDQKSIENESPKRYIPQTCKKTHTDTFSVRNKTMIGCRRKCAFHNSLL